MRDVGLGLFLKAGYVKEGVAGGSALVFYCPSFQGDIDHYFNANNNPWPPSNNTTRCTYSCRGSTNNPDPKTPNTHATDAVVWGVGSKPGPFYPLKVVNGSFSTATHQAGAVPPEQVKEQGDCERCDVRTIARSSRRTRRA